MKRFNFLKQAHYFLLPLLFIAALIVFTVLMLPLSLIQIPGMALIAIFLIVLIATLSSLVALLVFIVFLSGQEK